MGRVTEGEAFGAHRSGEPGSVSQVAPGDLGRSVGDIVKTGQVAAEQLDLQCGADQNGKRFQECRGQRRQRQHGAQRQLPAAHQGREAPAAQRDVQFGDKQVGPVRHGTALCTGRFERLHGRKHLVRIGLRFGFGGQRLAHQVLVAAPGQQQNGDLGGGQRRDEDSQDRR